MKSPHSHRIRDYLLSKNSSHFGEGKRRKTAQGRGLQKEARAILGQIKTIEEQIYSLDKQYGLTGNDGRADETLEHSVLEEKAQEIGPEMSLEEQFQASFDAIPKGISLEDAFQQYNVHIDTTGLPEKYLDLRRQKVVQLHMATKRRDAVYRRMNSVGLL